LSESVFASRGKKRVRAYEISASREEGLQNVTYAAEWVFIEPIVEVGEAGCLYVSFHGGCDIESLPGDFPRLFEKLGCIRWLLSAVGEVKWETFMGREHLRSKTCGEDYPGRGFRRRT
jgi:hypothetical protein